MPLGDVDGVGVGFTDGVALPDGGWLFCAVAEDTRNAYDDGRLVGAFVGMAEEVLHAGPLAEVGPEILATRAAARAAHGWIMDIYLLRRS